MCSNPVESRTPSYTDTLIPLGLQPREEGVPRSHRSPLSPRGRNHERLSIRAHTRRGEGGVSHICSPSSLRGDSHKRLSIFHISLLLVGGAARRGSPTRIRSPPLHGWIHEHLPTFTPRPSRRTPTEREFHRHICSVSACGSSQEHYRYKHSLLGVHATGGGNSSHTYAPFPLCGVTTSISPTFTYSPSLGIHPR